MLHINQSDVSELELLNRNSAKKIKRDVKNFLSTAKQAGLLPQHTMEMNGLFLKRVKTWEEAYQFLCHYHLSPSGAKLDEDVTSCQASNASIPAHLLCGGKK